MLSFKDNIPDTYYLLFLKKTIYYEKTIAIIIVNYFIIFL